MSSAPHVTEIAIDVIDDAMMDYKTDAERLKVLNEKMVTLSSFSTWTLELLEERALGNLPEFIVKPILKDIKQDASWRALWSYCEGLRDDYCDDDDDVPPPPPPTGE